jgi:hypothetical protein
MTPASVLRCRSGSTLREALQRFEEAIAGEVLAVECVYENDGGADAREIDIEGMKAAVSIAVV